MIKPMRNFSPEFTDCHGKHTVLSHLDEQDKTYRANIPKLCVDCHSKLAAPDTLKIEQDSILVDYSSSVHGQGLIKKGLLPSAVCTDCHSTHYILNHEVDQSSTYPENLPATCATCHRGIYNEFVDSIQSPSGSKTADTFLFLQSCIELISSVS